MFKAFLITLLIASTATFSVTVYGLMRPVSAESAGVVSVPGVRVRAAPSAIPATLSIPALNIHTDVEQIGIAKSGRMATSESFSTVSWYKYGSAPGERGNAVFAGHLDNALGMDAVFADLGQLEPGDDIYVTSVTGGTLHFKVERKEVLSYDSTDTDEIFATAGTPRIVLITCEGMWDQEHKQYTDRLAVFATLVI